MMLDTPAWLLSIIRTLPFTWIGSICFVIITLTVLVLYSLQTSLLSKDVSKYWKNFDFENCINNGRSVESVKSKSLLVWFYCNASTFHDFIINSVKQYVLFSRTGVLKSDGTGTFYNLPILQFGHELILAFYLILYVFLNHKNFCFLQTKNNSLSPKSLLLKKHACHPNFWCASVIFFKCNNLSKLLCLVNFVQ